MSGRRILPRAALLFAALLAVALGLGASPPAHALAPLPACGDNLDNDLVRDGRIDWPLDPGCSLPTDTTEVGSNGTDPVTQCSDGLDTGDVGKIDYPNDAACSSAADTTETTHSTTQCSNGGHNDGDSLIDYPNDPGCISASDNSEADTACSDKLDNDNDGKADFPLDWGCGVPVVVVNPPGPNQADTDETDPPQCNDGRDNDGDGTLDFNPGTGFTADSDCASATDTVEATPPPAPQCSDGFDNDIDGTFDFPSDPGCSSPADNDETDLPPCSDGIDNDEDGLIDGADSGCSAATDTDETNPVQYPLPPGNLGGSSIPPPPPPPPPSTASPRPRVPLLTPFPIVRLRGSVAGGLIRVSLLSVRAPAGSKVTVYCSGVGCPVRRVAINAGRRLVRVRRFEKRLRGGTILKIYVTRPGFVGKYTRFRFLSNRAPLRIDRCATKPGIKPKLCPSS